MGCILICEADRTVAWEWRQCLEAHGYKVVPAADLEAVERSVAGDRPALLVLSLDSPGCRWREVVRRLRSSHPDMPILGTMACGTVELVADALASGASDVLVKPMDPIRLVSAIGVALGRLGQAIAVQPGARLESDMAGVSPGMQAVFHGLAKAAASDLPLIISGPPGSGKSLASWIVHRHSSQQAGPFRTFDFRVIPSSQAMRMVTSGCPSAADVMSGTLVIDGAMSLPPPQLAGLRTLAGVRVILIVDADHDGRIDADWVVRTGLSQVISIAPLRSHPEDFVPVVRHLLQRESNRLDRALELSPQALFAMTRHDWPRNVRELHETLLGAIDLAVGGRILAEHLAFNRSQSSAADLAGNSPLVALADAVLDTGSGKAFSVWRDRIDSVLITQALKQTRGNQMQASVLLGLSRPTLRRRCASLGIPPGSSGTAG